LYNAWVRYVGDELSKLALRAWWVLDIRMSLTPIIKLERPQYSFHSKTYALVSIDLLWSRATCLQPLQPTNQPTNKSITYTHKLGGSIGVIIK
jgi:hypothetical protein